MQKNEENDPEYQKKLNSIYYRHVTKQTQGKKKYYYSMQPGFYTSIKGHPSNSSNKNIVTVTMKTGSTYTGEVNERNERHGYGVYLVINGGSYEGYWKNGFKDGKGVFKYKDGTLHYEGDWQCGEPHGNGKVYNMSGKLKYEGKFKNGKSDNGIYWLDFKNM